MCLIGLENVTATVPRSPVLNSKGEIGWRKGKEEPEECSGKPEARKQTSRDKL